MLRHLLIAIVGVCSLIGPGKAQEEESVPTDDLGGWAGLYSGTGTTLFVEWTTEYAEEYDIEPYRVVDTLAFEAPVEVEIDTSRFCRATEVEGIIGSSGAGSWRIADPSCPPADLHVLFEDFRIDIQGRERMLYSPGSFQIHQEHSPTWSWWATFSRSSDGAITGTVHRHSQADYAATHNRETTTLSLVRDESDKAVEEDPTAVEEADEDSTPGDFALYDGFPNPFNSSVLLRFEVAGWHPSELAIYSTGSQRVATLVSQVLPRGRHLARWDGRSDDGHTVASGVYLARLTSGPHVAMRKLVLIR